MASVKIDPEGGNPVLSGTDGKGPKQANDDPVQIPVTGPDANTNLPQPVGR